MCNIRNGAIGWQTHAFSSDVIGNFCYFQAVTVSKLLLEEFDRKKFYLKSFTLKIATLKVLPWKLLLEKFYLENYVKVAEYNIHSHAILWQISTSIKVVARILLYFSSFLRYYCSKCWPWKLVKVTKYNTPILVAILFIRQVDYIL